ncbi:MAG: hypothetical protein IVW57_07620 [Ktedonobacterales bacterium]|nr:hypothetical protein [Ktedonobacterales bacterium]
MVAAGIGFHLFNALRRAFWRVLTWFFLTGLIAAVVTELAGIFATGGRLPTALTHLVALGLFLAVGYAAGMTVLVGEIFRSLLILVRDIGQGLERGVEEGGKLGGVVARGMERLERRV